MDISKRSLVRLIIISNVTCAFAATLLTGSLILGVQAVADQDAATDTVPRLIPYNGYLELDGQPVTLTGADAPDIRFEICDAADCSSVLFEQTITVSVYNGQFTALIGEENPNGTVGAGGAFDNMQEAIAAANELYLQMHIDAGSGEVTLSNSQRLLITPHAIWATNASDFEVADVLTVNGQTTFDDVVTINNGHTLNVGGVVNGLTDVNTGSGAVTFGGDVNVGDGGDEDLTVQDRLTINGDATLGDNDATDTHTINGATTINGTTTINSEVRVNTINTLTDVNTGNGDVTFGGDITVEDATQLGDASTDTHTVNGTLTMNNNALIVHKGGSDSDTTSGITLGDPSTTDYAFIRYSDDGNGQELTIGTTDDTSDDVTILVAGVDKIVIGTNIQHGAPARIYRSDTEPFACNSSSDEGYLWYDTDRGSRDETLCLCTNHGSNSSTRAWKPIDNRDGSTCE